jgi:signal transduction histidine kinase
MYENEKLSSLGRLSTSVAHEVKNPLSSIKAIVQVLKEDSNNESKTQKSLSIIVEEIDRLTKVVNQLLVFAKPQMDNKSTVKISDVINKVLVVLRHEAKMNNVNIHLDVSDDLPVITVDEGSLNEVFFNIIHNAIQAMSEGGKLTISISYDQKNDYITVVFENTGSCISEEDMGKIFEPFYTTKQMGTGLGLAIVKRKLEELGGMIHVKSEDSSTRFTVKIPSSESVLVSNI